MKVAILCREEPVFLGPYLQQLIGVHPRDVAAVFIVGGPDPGRPSGFFRGLSIDWCLLEPSGFFHALWRRLRASVLGARGPDSVAGFARRLDIPVHRVDDPNGARFLGQLHGCGADVGLNESGAVLKGKVLWVPRFGFVKRHGSLLPAHRGRMSTFWSHADVQPMYGTTIHSVSEEIDAGGIIVQQHYDDIAPEWPYPAVMTEMLSRATTLFWHAMELLETHGARLRAQSGGDEIHMYPTLEEAKSFVQRLQLRRAHGRGRRRRR